MFICILVNTACRENFKKKHSYKFHFICTLPLLTAVAECICVFIGILITFRANTPCDGFQEFGSYNGIENTCTEDNNKIRKSTPVYIWQLGSQCRQEFWVACQSPDSMLRTQKHRNLLLDRKAGPVSMVRGVDITWRYNQEKNQEKIIPTIIWSEISG